MTLLRAALLAASSLLAMPAFAQGMEPADVVREIYNRYLDNGDGTSVDDVPLSRRIAPYVKAAQGDEDGVGALDFDPFVNGQDYDVTAAEVEETERSDADATVVAHLTNFGQPQDVEYYFVRESGTWRIDDISWGEEGTSLWTVVMPAPQ